TNSSDLPPARGVLRSSSSGCAEGSTRDARLFRTRSISVANGRACWMRSCARRSLDAATIFIALVICCVDLTARMRRRISNRDGMLGCGGFLRGREVLPELLQRLVQILLDRVVDLLLVRQGRDQLRLAGVEEAIELRFIRAHRFHRHRIEVAVGGRV